MLRALIFDFDGVVADNEPIHFAMFRRVLGSRGLFLSKEAYYREYLGFDDKGCFSAFLRAHGRPVTPDLINELIAEKATAYLDYIRDHLVIFPGVCNFVHEAARRHRLAIASGALRHEIEFILEQAGLREAFEHITSAEDVLEGKPNPEPYLHALQALNRQTPNGQLPLSAGDCLVIEDSVPGVQAAHAAGMKVVAVTNTHPQEDLGEADMVTDSLAAVTVAELARRLWS
jgi:HAD superfamily hydrolase (TIGR01509 family)